MNQKFKFVSIIIGISILTSCSSNSHKQEAVSASGAPATTEEVVIAEEEIQRSVQFTAPYIQSDALEMESNKDISLKKQSESIDQQPSRPNFIASQAASAINDDGIHKLIRTARMRFKVKDAAKATYDIENIVIRNNGFIIKSAIQSDRPYSTTTYISEDSALIVHRNNLVADISLRVHRSKLDTLLKEIAPLAIEIDYRTVEAQDVTLQLLSEKLKQERMNKKQKRVSDAIDNKGRRLDNIIDAENTLDNALEQADNAKLSAYNMNDLIEYSTVNIQLYQNPTTYTERVAREKHVEDFKPGLGSEALDALHNGWVIISSLLILLLNIWPIILIVLAVVFLYIKYKKRGKNN